MAKAKAIKAENDNFNFTKGDYIMHPSHGVGQVQGVDMETIGGMQVKLCSIGFKKNRLVVKVPVTNAKTVGLRRLSSEEMLDDVFKTLKGRSRIRRTMWSRRAQEYEAKINSGDPVLVAEVLRDLKQNRSTDEQSYSERQIYQAALERLASEISIIRGINEDEATKQLEMVLTPKRMKKMAEESEMLEQAAA